MKNIYYLLFLLPLLAACKKNTTPKPADGCISQEKEVRFFLTPADSTAALRVLRKNNLPTNDLQVEYIQQDTVIANGVTNVAQYLFAVQYVNGFPVLSSDFGYTFKNDVFTGLVGTRFSNINLDTRAKHSLQQVRKLYLDEVTKKAGADAATDLKSACLVAQFGYYDVNVRSAVANHPTDFVMAWSIVPEGKQYPNVLIRDDNGVRIAYY